MTIANEIAGNNIRTFRTRDECRLLLRFSGYLEHVSQSRIFVASGNDVFDLPYATRFDSDYRRKQIARVYRVEEYLRSESRHTAITMMTLTGYQRGLSRGVVFSNIRSSLRLLLDRLRKVCKGIQYMWVMEPHKSGYPHVHVAIFGYLSQDVRNTLQRLWTDKYGVGSQEHGIDFSVSTAREGIKSVRNYLMKYITKGLNPVRNWTPEERLYYAIAWDGRYRLITMSRSLSTYCLKCVQKVVRTGPKLSVKITDGFVTILRYSKDLFTLRDLSYFNGYLRDLGAKEQVKIVFTGDVGNYIQSYTIAPLSKEI